MLEMWRLLVVIAFGSFHSYAQISESSPDEYSLTIRLNGVVPERPDDLVCIGRKLDPQESYIVKFTPHANKATAHHMMVYGCHRPANPSYNTSWHCPEAEGRNSPRAVCADGDRQIFFAWAMDAPAKALPEGVGFRVSGATGIDYLVVQLHYAKTFADGLSDNSGVTLHMTHQRPPQQAGYIVLGTWGYIPPQLPVFYMESMCTYTRNYTIYPIGYRTHSHNLGVVTSGYRIRDGQWTEIGRMSPQLPETFYNVSNPGMDIQAGDQLVGRCTMNSMARHDITQIGPTNHDEMCNFYIMYSTYWQPNLATDFCFSDARTLHWTDYFQSSDIPKDASSLIGIPRTEEVREKFNMNPKRHLTEGK